MENKIVKNGQTGFALVPDKKTSDGKYNTEEIKLLTKTKIKEILM